MVEWKDGRQAGNCTGIGPVWLDGWMNEGIVSRTRWMDGWISESPSMCGWGNSEQASMDRQ